MTTTPVRNEPLARKVFDHIVAHPEEWNQGYWYLDGDVIGCGTVACFAGTAAIMNGAVMAAARDGWDATADGQRVPQYAAVALGLTGSEADTLFASENSLPVLRELLAGIYGGEW